MLFLELVNDDNVQLRNLAIKAASLNIIKLSQDQRTFAWGSSNKKLMTVPFDENPYSAFAAYLKTDEGVEVFKSIEKKAKNSVTIISGVAIYNGGYTTIIKIKIWRLT